MITKENKLYISEYLDIYGALLNSKACEILRQYYDCDMSLNEISENYDMTRQGVRSIIVRAENQLQDYESALKLYEHRKDMSILANSCREALDNGDIDKLKSSTAEMLKVMEDYNGRV